MQTLLASLRVAAATMLICVAFYSTAIWGVAQAIAPHAANGSLIANEDGAIVGSRQIAQAFTGTEYFWPRPSAVDYDGAGAGGSNWSPTSTDVADRGREMADRYGATPENPLPADLAAASGAGLDPHISEAGARYQVARIAEARGVEPSRIDALVDGAVFAPGGFLSAERIVNVLELNMALDRL